MVHSEKQGKTIQVTISLFPLMFYSNRILHVLLSIFLFHFKNIFYTLQDLTGEAQKK